MDLKVAEESKEKSSVEVPPELELKELPSHLEYAFLEDSNKFPVIIAKNLKVDEREALINVLKSHKRAIAWKISDIKGIDLRFYTHKILIEDDYKLVVQSQRRVNPKIHDVIKKEVIKFLDAGMIYPISDSSWVSLIHCVPKKGGYFQIPIDPHDKEKTTFTCPYGTFAYRHMPFGLCNAPGCKAKVALMVLLLQEFDITILDKKGSENLAADHLSRLENPHQDVLENIDINENFPLETLGSLTKNNTPWPKIRFSSFIPASALDSAGAICRNLRDLTLTKKNTYAAFLDTKDWLIIRGRGAGAHGECEGVDLVLVTYRVRR
nr:retrovirus-related Pol polyprotein from transposon 17.6 [Tanacetum cinerariifolium]